MTNDQIVAQIKNLALQYNPTPEQLSDLEENYTLTNEDGSPAASPEEYDEAAHFFCAQSVVFTGEMAKRQQNI